MRIVKFDSPVNKIKNQKFAHIEDFPKNSKIESKFVVLHRNYNTSVLILRQGVIYIDRLPPETTHKHYPLVAQRAFKHVFDGMFKFGLINRRDTLEKHLEAIDEATECSSKRKAVGLLDHYARETGLVFTEEQIEYLNGVLGGKKWQ